MINWYTYASLSTDVKKIDLRRWGEMHRIIANRLGININENTDAFIEISDILRELVDKLDRFPHFDEFLAIWEKRHPKQLAQVAKCNHRLCRLKNETS